MFLYYVFVFMTVGAVLCMGLWVLEKLLVCLMPRPRVVFRIGQEIIMEARFSSVEEVDVDVSFENALEEVVAVDGIPTWQVEDSTIATLTVAADGRSAVLRSTGVAGNTRVIVTADADLGEGVVPITGVLDVSVSQSGAIAVNFSVSTPRPRTPSN